MADPGSFLKGIRPFANTRHEWFRLLRPGAFTAVLCGVMFGLLYAFRTDPAEQVILPEDGGTYVLLARSILEGHGLASLWVAGAPEHAKAPFGFPLFLAPWIAWRGFDTGVLTYAMTGMAGAALVAVFCFFRRVCGISLAMLLVVLTALNGKVYLYGRSLLSEVPYLFWSLVSLWAVSWYFRRTDSFRRGALLAVLMLAAFFTRTAGIFLMLAFVAALVLRQQRGAGITVLIRKQAWLVSALFIPVAWWFWRGVHLTGLTSISYVKDFIGGNYNEPMSVLSFGLRVVKGAYALVFYAIPKVVSNFPVTDRAFGPALLSALTLGGLAWCLVRRRRTVDIYVALYLAFACSWPWVQMSGVRYMTVLAPFLLYYAWVGVYKGMAWAVKDKRMPLFRGAVLGLMIAAYVVHSPVLAPASSSSGNPDPQAAVFEWIRSHTPPQSVFVSWTPIAVYIYAGRVSADFASSTFNAAEFERLAGQGKADFLLTDMSMEQAARIFAPVYVRHPSWFTLVYQRGTYRIYRLGQYGQ